MSKILITGASGFVGINLIPFLKKREFKIVAFSRNNGCTYESLNDHFLNRERVDTIVHLAGKAHDLRKPVDEKEYFKANTELTIQIFDSFLKSKTRVFIFVSSIKAISDSSGNKIVTENTDEIINNIYGKTKKMAEDYILSNLPEQNKRVYILRPCMIHGPGNKGNLNLLYKMVSKGIPWPLGAFENKRSFCSVENLCFVIKEFLERTDVPSGVYNIADSESISTNELIEIIGVSFKKKPLVLSIPTKIIMTLSRVGDFFHLPLNSERLKKLTENYEVSNHKLVKALGKELPIRAREGLAQTFKSFNSND